MPTGLSYGRTNAAFTWKPCPRPETARDHRSKRSAPRLRARPGCRAARRGRSCWRGGLAEALAIEVVPNPPNPSKIHPNKRQNIVIELYNWTNQSTETVGNSVEKDGPRS